MFNALKTIQHDTVLISTLLSTTKPHFYSLLRDVHLHRVRSEIYQLSINTFNCRVSDYIAAQQYLHSCNVRLLVPLRER